MVILGPATFPMGSPPSEPDRNASEHLHITTIDRGFSIAATEVTTEQFRRFLKGNPQLQVDNADNELRSDVEIAQCNVSWFAAAACCNWLTTREGLGADQQCYVLNQEQAYSEGMKLAQNYLTLSGYRLPTEAEWEYACRSGTTTRWSCGQSAALLPHYAWIRANSDGRVHRVATRKPNLFGLFDMHGNLYEWCQEHFESDYPTQTTDVEDAWLWVDDTRRVLRSGSIRSAPAFVRSADRNGDRPSLAGPDIGFRIARTIQLAPPETAPETAGDG